MTTCTWLTVVHAACTAHPIGGQGESGGLDPGGGGTPGSPNPGGPIDDEAVQTGLEFWNAQCAGCHGNFAGGSAISAGDINGDFRLDADSAVTRLGAGLESFISDQMPRQNPAACQGDCAQLTGAYVRSRRVPTTPANCDGQEGAIYGVRELKLLSSQEYQHALEDLLGFEANLGRSVSNGDGVIGGFVNMRGKGVGDAIAETYLANAESVAQWAITQGRPFTCDGTAACASRFVDEFLFKAFRGAVSDEQRALFVQMFEDYPADGMRVALEAALSSPYFLYRVEAGVDLQTAQERGFYTNTAGGSDAPNGAPIEVISAADFPTGSGALEGDVWALTQNGGLNLTFDSAFSDPTIIEVDARGSNHDDRWPELTVRVQGVVAGVQTVDRATIDTFRFVVSGQTGTPAVRIEFNNDSGVPPYGPGQDVNLYIARVGIVTAASEPTPSPPPEEESPLAGVDSDAFVLTPYEFASSLSFMLTGSTPDAPLLEAARRDQLTTRAQVRQQVERLIDSPRGREHFKDFATQWFGLDKVKSASRPEVPAFTPEVKEAMVEEVRTHFAHVFYEDDVPYSEFFGGNYTFVNRTLAEFYGIPGGFGDAFVKTEVSGRGGPIASGAFMAANAHVERTAPILRAVHARQAALCHSIDPPNAPIAGENIDDERAAAQNRVVEREAEDGGLSSRDFYFLYTDGIQACAGCHERIINPMFGMEDFDNVGRLRPSAGAGAVTERIGGLDFVVPLEGTLYGVDSVSDPNTITYAGAKDLSNKIAETDAVKACLVRKGFRYATGLTYLDRDLDTGRREQLTEAQRQAYGCAASRMTDALIAGGESPRAMFIELATESLVRLRR